MRLHRDDEPGQDEPEDGWATASAPPSGPLSDVLSTWSVVRRWRGVKAATAAEAIAATSCPGGPDESPDVLPVDVQVSRHEMTMLYLTKDELGMMLSSIGASLIQTEANMKVAHAEAIKALLRNQWSTFNSLRTAFTEARWGLMTPEEIEAERVAFEEARAAGLIK